MKDSRKRRINSSEKKRRYLNSKNYSFKNEARRSYRRRRKLSKCRGLKTAKCRHQSGCKMAIGSKRSFCRKKNSVRRYTALGGYRSFSRVPPVAGSSYVLPSNPDSLTPYNI